MKDNETAVNLVTAFLANERDVLPQLADFLEEKGGSPALAARLRAAAGGEDWVERQGLLLEAYKDDAWSCTEDEGQALRWGAELMLADLMEAFRRAGLDWRETLTNAQVVHEDRTSEGFYDNIGG